MSGIICIGNYVKDLESSKKAIENTQKYLDFDSPLQDKHCLLANYHLKENDVINKEKPLSYVYDDMTYQIAFIGELYNAAALKKELIENGFTFTTSSHAEIVLVSYIAWQKACLDRFDGAFAFVINHGDKLFAARDPLGIKPLYYLTDDTTIVISNEIKALLAYQNKAIVDKEGVKELLGLGPSMSPGKTIYKIIFSLRPAHYLDFTQKVETTRYWQLEDQQHHDDFETSVKTIKQLVIDNIVKQLSSQDNSTMLSGGLDSSIITSIASMFNEDLATYSVEYEDQKKFFKAYAYQTTMDDDYIQEMIERYQTKHQTITLQQDELINSLEASLIQRDMPGMADIDSSFLLFAKEIAQQQDMCLSGECADEIFGGYPWFYKEELSQLPYFPWMKDLDAKLNLFNEKVQALDLKSYIIEAYQNTLNELNTDDRKKQLIYLNIEWFMQTLLLRAYCLTNRLDLNVRVPFASKDILTYVYNMPWEYLYHHQEEKGLLRLAFEDFLPDDIAHRKKNPFPKTHSPIYTDLIYHKLKESLQDEDNILLQFFDKPKLIELIESKGESFTSPWYGQLMMGPQLLAYFYQIYLWAKLYHIELEF